MPQHRSEGGEPSAPATPGLIPPSYTTCRDAPDRCRPYFIGLLGERYGWVPPAGYYRPELLERAELQWLKQHQGGASVTELEILHGVLNPPQMDGQAFFYFRDPAWSRAQTEPGFVSSTPAEAQQLAALKQRIRASGFPLADGLPDPEAIAARIEADLWALIESLHPELDQADALEREQRKHASYRQSRLGVYLGGEAYLQQLQGWIEAGEPRILISGDSGAGKSALIANWLAAHQQAYPGDVVHAHHLGCSNDANAIRPLLARMLESASRLLLEHDLISEAIPIPSDWWELTAKVAGTIQDLGRWCRTTGQRWIWVLDGLDRLDAEDQQALPWLPLLIPAGVSVVISALACPAREIVSERGCCTLTIGALERQAQEGLIQRYLQRYTKQLDARLCERILAHPQAGSPLFLRVLLEELRQCGRFETLEHQLAFYLAAETVDGLYERVLERLETGGHGEAVRSMMTALWASRAGLSESELLAITGLAPLQWAPIDLALEQAFGRNGNRLVFDHDYLRQAVQQRYLPTKDHQRQAHSTLADWFASRDGWDERNSEEFPWQLQQAGRLEELRDWLLEPVILAKLQNDRGSGETLGYWRMARAEDEEELDELITEAVEQEIERQKDDFNAKIQLIDRIADLIEDAGLYRALLSRLRRLALELEGANRNSDLTPRLCDLANLCRYIGDYAQAEVFYLQALKDQERLLGPCHCATLMTVKCLGDLFIASDNLTRSEAYLSRCFAGFAQALGADHPWTVGSEASLGHLYLAKGDYERAQACYQRCLGAFTDLYGIDHPDVSAAFGWFGDLYFLKGDFESAEGCFILSLEGLERIMGPQHPSALSARGSLAVLYLEKGDYETAESELGYCLETIERIMGFEHPSTLTIMHNLASLFWQKGCRDQAEEYYKRCLGASKRVLGEDHRNTLDTACSLAVVLQDKADYELAEKLYMSCLVAREKALGSRHRDTLTVSLNLASLFKDRGDFKKAELYYMRCLQEQENVLGPEHPKTLITLASLGELYRDQGNHELSEEMYHRSLVGREKALGPDHPSTLTTAYNLAEQLSQLKRCEEAIPLRQRELAWARKQNGDINPDTLDSIHGLAIDLLETGEIGEAEILFRELLASRQVILSPEDFEIGSAYQNLANTLQRVGKLEEAAVYAQQALEHRLAHEGPEAWWTNVARFDLAFLMQAIGRELEAINLLNELEQSLATIEDPDEQDQALMAEALELRSRIEAGL